METTKGRKKGKGRSRRGTESRAPSVQECKETDYPQASSASSDVERQISDAAKEDFQPTFPDLCGSCDDSGSQLGLEFLQLSMIDDKELVHVVDTELTDFNVSSTLSNPSTVDAETSIENLRTVKLIAPPTAVKEHCDSIVEFKNTLLESNVTFEEFFINSQKVPPKENILMERIQNYLKTRIVVISLQNEILTAKKEALQMQQDLWIMEQVVVNESGECQDGNPVSVNFISSMSKFSDLNHSRLKDAVMSVKRITHHLAESLFDRGVAQQYVLITLHEAMDALSSDELCEDIGLRSGDSDNLAALRSYASVLFYFYRHNQDDMELLMEIQDWLSMIVGVMLRLSKHNDHFFLLHHILRCPPGIPDWMVQFIQIPYTTDTNDVGLDSPLITHAIAVLGIILKPITAREEFLHALYTSPSAWVIVDMDSDSSGTEVVNASITILEEDLIKVMNQVPFEHLFREIYSVSAWKEDDGSETFVIAPEEHFTHTHMSKLIGISVFLINLFDEGLRTYNKKCYKQFAKRLCCYICDVVRHFTDVRDHFRAMLTPARSEWCALQEQYDALFERAAAVIFSSRDLGVWQFLTNLPYGALSESTLWGLLYKLLKSTDVDFSQVVHLKQVMDADLLAMFVELLESLTDEEVYYLLSTIAAMALECRDADNPFVAKVTVNLVKIGAVCKETKEKCLKSVQPLLSNLTQAMPSLISLVLSTIDADLSRDADDCFYLMQGLTLNGWRPLPSDLVLLSRWLVDGKLLSLEHYMACYVLKNLHFGYRRNQMFLDKEVHLRIALIAVEAVLRHAPEPAPSGSRTKLFAFGGPQGTSGSDLRAWAWDLMLRVRLHEYDHERPVKIDFQSIPDVYDDRRLEVVARGVLSGHALAGHVAVLATTWGHVVPEVCARGFGLLEASVRAGQAAAAVAALQHVVPLFTDCIDSLYQADKFLSLLLCLMSADKGDKMYLKMARNILAPEFPGPVLRRLVEMIEHQLMHYYIYRLQSPTPLVLAWLASLIRLPGWSTDASILYVVDHILALAFIHERAAGEVTSLLRNYLETKGPQSPPGSTGASTLMGWMSSSSSYPHSLLQTAGNGQAVWFATVAIDIDEALQEEVWNNTITSLYDGSQTNVDAALKKAGTVSPQALALYRWAQQAMVTPVGHPLVAYVWQRFFCLLLARASTPDGRPTQGGVGMKFFEGRNAGTLKSLKLKLKECEEYYTERGQMSPRSAEGVEEAYPQNHHIWCLTLKRLFQMYQLWIGEPRLFDRNLQLHTLPVVYEPKRLAQIFSQQKELLINYVDIDTVSQSHQTSSSTWITFRHRTPDTNLTPTVYHKEKTSLEKLVGRLGSYDKPLKAPRVTPLPSNLIPLNVEFTRLARELDNCPEAAMLTAINMFRNKYLIILDRASRELTIEARRMELGMSHMVALDCAFLDMVTQLYRNSEREVVAQASCSSLPRGAQGHHDTCAGPATLHRVLSEVIVDQTMKEAVKENRKQYKAVLDDVFAPLSRPVALAALQFNFFLQKLVLLYEELHHEDKPLSPIYDLLVEALYDIVMFFTDHNSSYPPTVYIYTSVMECLVTRVVYGHGTQTSRMLSAMMGNERVLQTLSPFFMPSDVSSADFVQMYSHVVNSLASTNPEACLVCLSKFDISHWLDNARPYGNERSALIEFIFSTLNKAGYTPPDSQLMVLELLRKHLCQILHGTFPEHFGQILGFILDGTSRQTLCIDVWYDFLNAMMGPVVTISRDTTYAEMKMHIYNFATSQTMLHSMMLVDTTGMLEAHFSAERHDLGLHGLYPKYGDYVVPIMALFNAIISSLLVTTLNENRGSPTEMLCNVIWPSLRRLYSPWISPWQVERSAAWVAQLAGSWLMPWAFTHEPLAHRVVACYTDATQFIQDTLPGNKNTMLYLWSWYARKFAQPYMTEFVLSVIHQHWAQLSWENFSPLVGDMESMLQILNAPLATCHSFVAKVFMSVRWSDWMDSTMRNGDNPSIALSHSYFLKCLVRLSTEKTVRQNYKDFLGIVQRARVYNWHTVHAVDYQLVLEQWVAASDPAGVLSIASDNAANVLEAQIYLLLADVAPLGRNFPLHSTVIQKRVAFVRASMTILGQIRPPLPKLVAINIHKFVLVLLDNIEAIVAKRRLSNKSLEEARLLLREVLVYANNPDALISNEVNSAACRWIQRREPGSTVVRAALRAIDSFPVSCAGNKTAPFGALMETTLEVFFSPTVGARGEVRTWGDVAALLDTPTPAGLVEGLAAEGHFLSVYAMHVKQNKEVEDIDLEQESRSLRRLLEFVKKRELQPALEPKLPLMWSICLRTIQKQAQLGDVGSAADNVRLLIGYLRDAATKKSDAWGFLGSMGFGSVLASISFRALTQAMCVFLLAQMPEGGKTATLRLHEGDPGAIAPTLHNESDISPSSEATKGLKELEHLCDNKVYADIKPLIIESVMIIKDETRTLLDSSKVLNALASKFYPDKFVQCMK